jgi:ABC-2 type transport system ATP-binding protein
MASAVVTDRLTKDFPVGFWRRRSRRALDALSLDIPAGDVFGLLGPNGAGKSTTLKLLLNLIWPTSGRAEILGRPAGAMDARQRIGFLPENPTFYDHLTAEELLAYFAQLFGESRTSAVERARRALDAVGLADERRRRLRQFSKGMLQRVGIAQAIVNDPELVILDEPMSGLDPVGRREVRELILGLRQQGRTVLFSSHILSDAELLCSRVAILVKGRLAAAGSVTELTSGSAAVRGWEIVVGGLPQGAPERLTRQLRRSTRIAEDRWTFDLAPELRPEPAIAELAAAGAVLISVTPVKATLEDVFLSAIRTAGCAPGSRADTAPDDVLQEAAS